MVICKIDQPVIGINDPVILPEPAFVVDVALIVFPALFLRQMAFPVAEIVAADAFAGSHIPEIALGADPAEFLGLVFGNEI